MKQKMLRQNRKDVMEGIMRQQKKHLAGKAVDVQNKGSSKKKEHCMERMVYIQNLRKEKKLKTLDKGAKQMTHKNRKLLLKK